MSLSFSSSSFLFLPLPLPTTQVKQALADADVCVAVRPDWEKSHFRRGMALEAGNEDNDAIVAFEAALATVTGATNPEIKSKIKTLKAKVRPSSIHVPSSSFGFPSAAAADPAAAAAAAAAAKSVNDKGGPKGDPEWLETAKSTGQPIHVRIGAVNKVAGVLTAVLAVHWSTFPLST